MAKNASAKPPKTGAPKPKESPARDAEKVTMTTAEFKEFICQAVEHTAKSLASDVLSEQAGAASRASRRQSLYDSTPVKRAEIDAIRDVLTELDVELRDVRRELRGKNVGPVNVVDQMGTTKAVATAFVTSAVYEEWLAEGTDDGRATPAQAVEWFAYALLCRGVVTSEQLASAFLAKF